MKGNDFKRWRKGLDLSQKDAADALGLKRRVVQYYEKGERGGGKPVKIPRTVRLACYAITTGVADYEGPDNKKPDKAKKSKKADSRENGHDALDGEKRDDKKTKKKKKDKAE
ncbi:MAG: helix-turn-helix transcriptional regulator [Alphaproteobacteria bacterium]|nr:helix-turn-helix transcriptional regulator [Alphaproteobacteria bacterium]